MRRRPQHRRRIACVTAVSRARPTTTGSRTHRARAALQARIPRRKLLAHARVVLLGAAMWMAMRPRRAALAILAIMYPRGASETVVCMCATLAGRTTTGTRRHRVCSALRGRTCPVAPSGRATTSYVLRRPPTATETRRRRVRRVPRERLLRRDPSAGASISNALRARTKLGLNVSCAMQVPTRRAGPQSAIRARRGGWTMIRCREPSACSAAQGRTCRVAPSGRATTSYVLRRPPTTTETQRRRVRRVPTERLLRRDPSAGASTSNALRARTKLGLNV